VVANGLRGFETRAYGGLLLVSMVVSMVVSMDFMPFVVTLRSTMTQWLIRAHFFSIGDDRHVAAQRDLPILLCVLYAVATFAFTTRR